MAAASKDETARVTLEAWLATDIGVVRDHNEDSAYMDPAKGIFIVADGMGGHAAGEVASAMAVETVRTTLEAAHTEIDAFKKAPTDAGRRGLVQLLQNAVLSAHQAVFQRGQSEQDKAGMGTTLDVVLVAGPEAFVAHVGDSRTYLIRDGRSSQITTDHTVAEVLVIEGKLTIEEAQVSPLRTILVNAIGVSADVGVEMAHVTLKRGDRLLLCSDGLHDYFPVEEEIANNLSAETPGKSLDEMVELAKTRGGHDNITGIAIHITDVVDAVPNQLEGESTQPVDLTTNPFADEPTETAFISPPGLPSRIAGGPPAMSPGKVTTPMRIVGDEASADTIPPPEVRKERETKAKKAKSKADKADVKPEPKDGAKAEDDADAKANASAAEGNTDAVKPDAAPADATKTDVESSDSDRKTIESPRLAKPVNAEPDGSAKSDSRPAADKDHGAAPAEIATADTGRVQLPKGDKGAS